MPFMFEVGKEYETQAGDIVKVLGRHDQYAGYESLICSDGRHRYDRSTYSEDAGRCTGTDFNYSCPHNLKRGDKKIFEFTVILRGRGSTESEAWDDAVQSFTGDPGEAESSIEIDRDGDPI